MEACSRSGNWRQALVVLEEMGDNYTKFLLAGGLRKRAVVPTAVHCNLLLSAYCRGGRCECCVEHGG